MVIKVYYTIPRPDPIPGDKYLELELIKNFLTWQKFHYNAIEGTEAIRLSQGRSLVVVEIALETYVETFQELYEYFKKEGLFFI